MINSPFGKTQVKLPCGSYTAKGSRILVDTHTVGKGVDNSSGFGRSLK